ncbi:dynamin family protein [Marinibacterium sp. SX1]|uniref:dynamin family protein n=1 Tax=Marinibacterium sp. SX1 TaxID=3388424 RepID=UPI003D16E847
MSDAEFLRERHRESFKKLNELWSKLDALEDAVVRFSDRAPSFVEDPVEDVLGQIRSFEPSVSVIGQVKAGKSTLLNALIGQPDLLPSDVNPWTSVITGLHLNSRHRPANMRALFRFFDQEEWDRLVATGGRLGEMADRAGFEGEADEVRAQVTDMRRTTEERLGDEFDRLLGSSHAFPSLDKSTIDRYICYGDPDDLADGATEGVYADITKSADLYVDLPEMPRGLCLRDTPGVNDTFMMREQITLNAISDSRVCVVVLSAHQALSTMDLALLRIICSVEAREVLIFVNRIDELADPGAERPRIEASIRATLGRLGIPDAVEIMFGSGYWAQTAQTDIAAMAPASRAALASLHDGDTDDLDELRRRALEASGIFDLHRAIAQRVVDGPGKAVLNDVRSQIKTIIEMSETVESAARHRSEGLASTELTAPALAVRLDVMREDVLAEFDANVDALRDQLRDRLDRARDTFVASALTALQSHIDTFGEIGTWNHDPAGLRMMMKTAFTLFCSKLRREGESGFDRVLDGVQIVLEDELGVYRDGGSVDFPEQPQHKAPTVLARILSLDLQGSWWRRYWRVGKANAAQKRYHALIMAETSPLIDELIGDFFDPAAARTRDIIDSFAMNQASFCEAIRQRLADGGQDGPDLELGKLTA